MRRHARFASLAFLAVVFCTNRANAAGLYTSDRGVRPLGRGGAYVAGADDGGSIWYNPAGLADAGSTLFGDAAWVNFGSEFTRQTQVADSAGTLRNYQYPKVKGTTPFLPIPTLAATYNFGANKEYTLAVGLYAPYASITTYPSTVEGQPAPQRYSLISLDGSMLVVTGAYFAFKPVEQFRIGIGLEALVGTFNTKVTFSASPSDRLIGAPEQPEYDALSQLKVGPIVSPTGTAGMTIVPEKHVRIGLSGHLPIWVDAPASVQVRLPTAAPFDRAYQQGDEGRVKFKLPAILRAGVEVRADLGANDTKIRGEVSYVHEFWSMHDSIDVVAKDIRLYNITGFPSPFGVAPISIPRNFQDTNSVRLGGELSTKAIFKENQTDFRAGIGYESSAIPREWVSPLTYDANKINIGIGGSIHVGEHMRMDAMGSLVLLEDTNVDPGEAKVPRVNPVKGNPTATEAVNGGHYSARALILGVGGQYKF